ncbi:Uncharacterized protein SCF082_LOCUS15896 [Durusdinium trenchii]|uniref:Late embryogenesis abundant protein LEA-2 subgroup domain-containing protein n=1 Tax=Durusdinium trenchii TaxID=1381693 RepID=A0ABP0K793_9DINO
MKPALVEEEEEDVPDAGSMKSFSAGSKSLRNHTQQSQASHATIGSRKACDAIQGVAPGVEEEMVEVVLQFGSEGENGEVAREKSMHLPMRCNYFEAAERLPTMAARQTHATQSSWGGDDDDDGEKRLENPKCLTDEGQIRSNNKNPTHSSYASIPIGQSMEQDDLEAWDDNWGVPSKPPTERKHPIEAALSREATKSEKTPLAVSRVLAVATGIFLGLFWPRDPTWKVTKLQVDAGELGKLVTAVSGGSAELAPKKLMFKAEVEVQNPNLLGGDCEEGQVQFTYQGGQMGVGKLDPASVPAQSSVDLNAELTLDISSEFVKSFQSELEADRSFLTFKAYAQSNVASSLGIQVHLRVACDIDVSLSFLMMRETQHRAVTGRGCRYTFF